MNDVCSDVGSVPKGRQVILSDDRLLPNVAFINCLKICTLNFRCLHKFYEMCGCMG